MTCYCGKRTKIYWGALIGVTVVTTLIACLASFIKPLTVKDGTYVIVIDGYTKKTRVIDTPGNNVIKNADKTVVFRGTAISYDWKDAGAMIVFSKDRVALTFTCKYQFILSKEGLEDVYETFGSDVAVIDLIQWTVESAIAIGAGNYTYDQFFQIRGIIENDIRAKIQEYVTRYDRYLTAGVFQLLNIAFPQALTDAIAAKAAAQQAVIASIQARDAVLSTATTQVQNAQYDASIAVINAQANAQGIISAADAAVRNAQVEAQATISSFTKMKEAVGGTNEALFTYLVTTLPK